MKNYNKLMRIKYNGKLFDIFSDEEYKKVFLEVKIINGKEQYFYININDYFYLNKVYNIKNTDVLYSNTNKKIKFAYKVYIALTSSFIVLGSLNIFDLLPNMALQRVDKFSSQLKDLRFDYDVISDISELEQYYDESISYDELRDTLNNNQKISQHYRNYLHKFIDSLERNLPSLNLQVFNDQLKTLEIVTTSEENWKNKDTGGFYDKVNNRIEVREGYDNDTYVIFHELIHALRIANIKVENVNLDIDYRISGYGNAFNEAFTELIADYLICDEGEHYFDKEKRIYQHYYDYAAPLYQILKLVGNEYTLYDFFNTDVGKFGKVLSKYDLEELIILYDLDLETSAVRNILIDDNSKLKQLETRLLNLRVAKELEKGTEINKIYNLNYTLTHVFDGKDSTESIIEISKCIKNNDDWSYCFTNRSSTVESNIIKHDINGEEFLTSKEYLNPNIKILHDDKMIYENSLFENIEGNIIDNLYVVSVIENNEIQYKLVRILWDKFIDVSTNKVVDSYISSLKLSEIVGLDYDIEINLTSFLKSDTLDFKMSKLNNDLNLLIELKNNGASDHEIYETAKQMYNCYTEVANFVLSKTTRNKDNWAYRITSEADVININEHEIPNPNFRIYKDNNVLYEGSMYFFKQDGTIDSELCFGMVQVGTEVEYRLLKKQGDNYFDFLTETGVQDVVTIIGLTSVIGEYKNNFEINLDTFMKSDILLESFEVRMGNSQRR